MLSQKEKIINAIKSLLIGYIEVTDTGNVNIMEYYFLRKLQQEIIYAVGLNLNLDDKYNSYISFSLDRVFTRYKVINNGNLAEFSEAIYTRLAICLGTGFIITQIEAKDD